MKNNLYLMLSNSNSDLIEGIIIGSVCSIGILGIYHSIDYIIKNYIYKNHENINEELGVIKPETQPDKITKISENKPEEINTTISSNTNKNNNTPENIKSVETSDIDSDGSSTIVLSRVNNNSLQNNQSTVLLSNKIDKSVEAYIPYEEYSHEYQQSMIQCYFNPFDDETIPVSNFFDYDQKITIGHNFITSLSQSYMIETIISGHLSDHLDSDSSKLEEEYNSSIYEDEPDAETFMSVNRWKNKILSPEPNSPVSGMGLNTGVYFESKIRAEDSISRTISQFSPNIQPSLNSQFNFNNQSIVSSGSGVPLPIPNKEFLPFAIESSSENILDQISNMNI